MENSIDIQKILSETLERYPTCAHLQKRFEKILQGHFAEFRSYFEDALQVGGLDEIRADYEKVSKSHKARFLRITQDFAHNSGKTLAEMKAEVEVERRFFSSVAEFLKKYSEQPAQDAPEPPALTFERLFIDIPQMDMAVKSVEGTKFDAKKRPHLRAFYGASVECKLIKDKRGKERRALPLIAEYFGASCHGNAVYQAFADEKIRDVLVRRMQKEREKSVKT